MKALKLTWVSLVFFFLLPLFAKAQLGNPDLICNIRSASFIMPDSLKVSYTITNIGNEMAVSTDRNPAYMDGYLGFLLTGGSIQYQAKIRLTIPKGIKPKEVVSGTFIIARNHKVVLEKAPIVSVSIIVDNTNVIVESNDRNNNHSLDIR
jgi:hypothetical protein